ncbi:hypothetical protein BDQ12DRAFT_607516 [Crucibulum laeve]|uniref:Histone-lysine N-methyltransferase, H3 lysine-36 specific n=1 Tax=Crucibulum laeve TaxID=68775 RepID=A0A5C3LXN8_9AGAR|nr:hypothetical protein BDQ12DRAFT_607516 [Crucibulum laeve]
MPPPKFKSSPTPTPPPTTTNGTNSATPTPPPSTPSINSRKAAATAPPQLIGDLPVARAQALSTFNEIPDNNYQYKTLGRSREALESMTCDCTYDHGVDNPGHACGPDSDCINRLTQVECLPDDCRCRSYCQNQRFQRKDYANIDIVLTEKKGFGLRAEADLPRDTFIYEYVGDVVNPISFKKRMRDYAQEGIQHFYFMMLQKDEFIDATKNGGIGRFANHSCNPNCYVAKWTVGDYVRMGIFTKRNIRKHEELTFNYNVDRYGHQAQICYCGEPNCVGYIGGKTQTDIATMDDLYLDALGITDEEDLMELKGTKKKKGKKIDDPDFMPTLKAIVEKDVPKVVQAIRQTQSRKVLSKLLTRIKITEDQAALRQIMRLRGYSLMTNVLQDYASDLELVALALECMSTWPLLNRNKVEDSKVIVPVQACTALGNEAVKTLAQNLIDHWETLPLYNRIPKRLKQDVDGEEVTVIPLYGTPEPPSKRSKYEFEGPSIGITPLGTTANATFEALAKPRESEDEARAKAVAILRAREVQNRQSVQAIIASAAEAAAAEEAAAITAAAVAKAKAEAAEEKAARRKNRPPKKVQTTEEKEANKEKRLLKLVGAVVVKCMSKYSKSMDHDMFKKHAKELTQIIADKEKKSSSYKEGRLDSLSDEKIAKIKKFAKEYIAKIIRRLEKSGQRARPTTQATPSTSMNTPNSADGDGVMETEMTVEEAMGMDADSGSEGEGDDDDRDTSGNGQAGIADSSPSEMTVSADMANELMDISESHEQALLPADPRRRPPADELAN